METDKRCHTHRQLRGNGLDYSATPRLSKLHSIPLRIPALSSPIQDLTGVLTVWLLGPQFLG